MIPCIVELCKVRIQGLAKIAWNGESLTRIRTLSTIEAVGAEEGTKLSYLQQATADNLTIETFTVPPSDCCATEYRPIRHKLKTPFRLTRNQGMRSDSSTSSTTPVHTFPVAP